MLVRLHGYSFSDFPRRQNPHRQLPVSLALAVLLPTLPQWSLHLNLRHRSYVVDVSTGIELHKCILISCGLLGGPHLLQREITLMRDEHHANL